MSRPRLQGLSGEKDGWWRVHAFECGSSLSRGLRLESAQVFRAVEWGWAGLQRRLRRARGQPPASRSPAALPTATEAAQGSELSGAATLSSHTEPHSFSQDAVTNSGAWANGRASLAQGKALHHSSTASPWPWLGLQVWPQCSAPRHS